MSLGATIAILAMVVALSWLSADLPPTLDGLELENAALVADTAAEMAAARRPPRPSHDDPRRPPSCRP